MCNSFIVQPKQYAYNSEWWRCWSFEGWNGRRDRNFEGTLEDEIVEEIVLLLPIIEDETWRIILNLLDCEEVYGESSIAIVKFMPMIEYDKHQIFKAILVSQHNAYPFLSKDRLTQVEFSMYFNNINIYINTSSSPISMLVGLGYDLGISLVSKNSIRISLTIKVAKKCDKGRPSKNNAPTSAFQRVDNGTWWIGWIQMMQRKFGTKWEL